MSRKWIISAAVLCCLAACGTDEPVAPAPTGTIAIWGSGCERSDECLDSGVCVSVLGGKACAPPCDGIGGAAVCADEVAGQCAADGAGGFGCTPTCDDAECPPGWSCVELGQGTRCAPEGANVNTCATGFFRCKGVCIQLNDDPLNCGECGNTCAEGATCVGKSCKCPTAAPDLCGGACVSTQTDEDHCGLCDTPCVLDHAKFACLSGSCTLVSCEDKFLNCDDEDATGCETAGSEVPVAVITIAGGTRFDELSTLTLSAMDSKSPNPVAAWTWSVSTPSGSLGAFVPDSTVQSPTFVPADLVGNYSFSLDITDSTGLESCGSATSVVTVVPKGLVHLELTWPEGGGDLDLHLRHEDAGDDGWFDASLDAWEGNPNPDWDDAGDDGDDPNLKQAMSVGPAVEILSLPLPPVDRSYQVGVHYRQGAGEPVTVQFRMFVNDKLEYSRIDVELAPGDLWDLGRLPWGEAFEPALGEDSGPIITQGVSAP